VCHVAGFGRLVIELSGDGADPPKLRAWAAPARKPGAQGAATAAAHDGNQPSAAADERSRLLTALRAEVDSRLLDALFLDTHGPRR
jgi:hypothetical protein